MPQGSVLGPILFVLYIQPLSQMLQSHCMEYQLFFPPNDSQLHRSSQPSDIEQTVLSVQECVSDIKDRMIDNKLQLNENKTEACYSILQNSETHVHLCPSAKLLLLSPIQSETSVFTWIKISPSNIISISYAKHICQISTI